MVSGLNNLVLACVNISFTHLQKQIGSVGWTASTLYTHYTIGILWICHFTTACNLQLQIWMECASDQSPECTLDFSPSFRWPIPQHSLLWLFPKKKKKTAPTHLQSNQLKYLLRYQQQKENMCKRQPGVCMRSRVQTSAGNIFTPLPDLFYTSWRNGSGEKAAGGAENVTNVSVSSRMSSHWTAPCELWLKVGVGQRVSNPSVIIQPAASAEPEADPQSHSQKGALQ